MTQNSYVKMEKDPKFMTLKEAKKIVKKQKQMGIEETFVKEEEE